MYILKLFTRNLLLIVVKSYELGKLLGRGAIEKNNENIWEAGNFLDRGYVLFPYKITLNHHRTKKYI